MYPHKTNAWLHLDRESRRRLTNDAVHEIARRTFPGALVYCASAAAILFASSVFHEHRILTVAAILCTLLAGLARVWAARHLLREKPPGAWWTRAFEIAVLATAGPWGIFCAAILYLYPGSWASTYLLIAGASLSGGVVPSLAPNLRLGIAALALIVLPSGLCGLMLGGAQWNVLAVSACCYLAWLIVQLRAAWKTYWKASSAAALEAMVSRKAASQSEDRFQTLFEDAPSGIYLARPDGVLEMVNGTLAQMLGYSSPEQLAGRNIREFSTSSDRMTLRSAVELQGLLHGWESDWRRKDGTTIRVHESVRAVQTGPTSRDCLLGIVEDITARFASDQARRQLVEILESTSDFVERISPLGETLYLNHAARNLMEQAQRDPGIAESNLLWGRIGDEELRSSRLRFADEQGIWQGESWLLGAGGKPVPVSQVIISHRASGAGPTQSYSVISRDISAIRNAQRALAEAGEHLSQAQRLESLGRLAGGIAHDFNNLLTIIIGHAAFLEERIVDVREQEGIAAIARAATRAADLTRQLLAFGRKQPLSKGVVDVKDAVRGAERLLQRLLGDKVRLVIRMSDDQQTVIADAGQLEQVLVNLVLNGRDAMPHGGVATVETSIAPNEKHSQNEAAPPEFVRIAVSDTGIGMDEHTMAQVFDPFFTTKSSGHGTGLGLATSHGFIEQCGGTLSVTSKPGEGSTFVILLPRSTAQATERTEDSPFDPRGTERVLVVDDEPTVRSFMRNTLAGNGYDVTIAQDADAALALAADAEPFDLLVSDMIMPGLTGPQLAKRLTERFPDMCVLFVSGYPGETEEERTAFGPQAGYLPKPFTAEKLLRSVRRQLERTHAAGART